MIENISKELYLSLFKKMLQVVAHDIKNPLSNILLSAAQLKTDDFTNKDDVNLYIDIIEKNCTRINKLLTEIIDTLYMGEPEHAECDITLLIQQIFVDYQQQFSQKNIICKYKFEEAALIRIDSAMIKTAWIQLVHNAMEAMPEGGELYCSIRNVTDKLELIIEDSGNGINNENKELVFLPFFTTKDRHRGLGLTYVKNIIETHGGTTSIRDSDNGGAAFSIFLPKK